MRRLAALLALWAVVAASAMAGAAEAPSVPVADTVTLVDLGAKACVPCKMMQPVLANLEQRYAGRVAVIFVDVWENRDEPRKYGLHVIPTQIFYDRSGREAFRHEGFWDEQSIAGKLDELLAK